MNLKSYEVYKPAYILLNDVRFQIPNGILINKSNSTFEIITPFEKIYHNLYAKNLTFDIIGFDNKKPVLIGTCRIFRQDIAVNQSVLSKGRFCRLKYLEVE